MNTIYCEKDIDDLISALDGLIKEDQKDAFLKLSDSLKLSLAASLRYVNPDTGRYSRFSQKDREDMYTMYMDGSTYSKIAHRYTCSVSYAAKIVDDVALEKRKVLWSFPDGEDDEIRTL